MEVYVDMLCLLAQPKEGQQQFKNKRQPELTENRTVWKSDHQGDKEETLTQTGRRGRDGQPGGEEGSKAEAGGPGDRPHNPGLQIWEVKPQTSDCKHLWGLRQQWEKLPASQESWLDRPTGAESMHKPTHWGISTRGAQFDCG